MVNRESVTKEMQREWGRKGAAKRWANVKSGKTQSQKVANQRRKLILETTTLVPSPAREMVIRDFERIYYITEAWRDFWFNRGKLMCNNRNPNLNIRCIKSAHSRDYVHHYTDDRYYFIWE